jgi:hypothetical protein
VVFYVQPETQVRTKWRTRHEASNLYIPGVRALVGKAWGLVRKSVMGHGPPEAWDKPQGGEDGVLRPRESGPNPNRGLSSDGDANTESRDRLFMESVGVHI